MCAGVYWSHTTDYVLLCKRRLCIIPTAASVWQTMGVHRRPPWQRWETGPESDSWVAERVNVYELVCVCVCVWEIKQACLMTAYSFMSLTPDSRQLCLLHHGSRIITLWPVRSRRVQEKAGETKDCGILTSLVLQGQNWSTVNQSCGWSVTPKTGHGSVLTELQDQFRPLA